MACKSGYGPQVAEQFLVWQITMIKAEVMHHSHHKIIEVNNHCNLTIDN